MRNNKLYEICDIDIFFLTLRQDYLAIFSKSPSYDNYLRCDRFYSTKSSDLYLLIFVVPEERAQGHVSPHGSTGAMVKI